MGARLPAWVQPVLLAVEQRWGSRFGEGSCAELWQAAELALESAPLRTRTTDDGAFERVRALIEQLELAHHERHGAAALAAEFREQQDRDAAVQSDAALVAYERKWQGKLRRLQAAHPSRWHVPGLSPDEVRDELTLSLLEAIRTQPGALKRHLRAGKEWGLSLLAERRRALCAAFKLDIVPTCDFSALLDREPNEEQRLIDDQTRVAMARAHERGAERLSRTQRRWLSAMKLSANAGGFFESSGRPNLAAASRVLGKDRSSAVRAFGELACHFRAELHELE